jgi:indolepyruvate decarboxylase
MPLGDFLVAYLQRAGVTHLFGLPGDLVLNLFYKFATAGRPTGARHRRRGDSGGFEIVTLSHEPGVGFAADAYARSTGAMGVLVVTYGAGGHNVVNPVAGSYAEEVPLLVISGGAGEQEAQLGTLIHHQAKTLESQHRIFREVTCASRVIRHPERAAQEIHELVVAIQTERRPGYLEIHRDVVEAEIPVPQAIRDWDGRIREPVSDREKVAEAARDTADRIQAARRPVLVAGIETHREHASRELVRLAERLGAPVVTTMLSKGAFPSHHPLHLGVHMGRSSPPTLRRRVEQADLVLALGALSTDIDMGTAQLRERGGADVWAANRRVDVSRHTYTDVGLRAFMRALLRIEDLRQHEECVAYVDNLEPPAHSSRSPVAVNDLLFTVNAFLAERRDYHVLADSGDMLFGGLEIRVPKGGLYFAQGFYASMGFSIPGSLGAQIGTGKRGLVLCGDGAFQMTGPELSHAPRYGCNPIVVLVNNGGWGIFRPVSPRADLLELPPWPYAELARAWGGVGFRVETVDELATALEAAHRDERFCVVEVIVDPDDLSPMSRRYIEASASRGRR